MRPGSRVWLVIFDVRIILLVAAMIVAYFTSGCVTPEEVVDGWIKFEVGAEGAVGSPGTWGSEDGERSSADAAGLQRQESDEAELPGAVRHQPDGGELPEDGYLGSPGGK